MRYAEGVKRLRYIREAVVEEFFKGAAPNDITENLVAQYVVAFCLLAVTNDPLVVHNKPLDRDAGA